jgi:chemotaxis protein MotA
MDPISIIGIVGAIAALLVSAMWEGTSPLALVNPSAFLIITGGTLGATIACYSTAEVLMLLSSIKLAFIKRSYTISNIFETFGELATLARRDGLLVLEHHPINIDSTLLKRGIRLVVDGTEPNLLKDLLSSELATMEERSKMQSGILLSAGGFAPTMGIIGTVIGLVNVLGSLSNPDDLGPLIATAFLATLYGIASANILFLPLGKKLQYVTKQDTQMGLLIIEGLISIQSGDNPRMVQEKLLSLIDENQWDLLRAQQTPGAAKK